MKTLAALGHQECSYQESKSPCLFWKELNNSSIKYRGEVHKQPLCRNKNSDQNNSKTIQPVLDPQRHVGLKCGEKDSLQKSCSVQESLNERDIPLSCLIIMLELQQVCLKNRFCYRNCFVNQTHLFKLSVSTFLTRFCKSSVHKRDTLK